MTFWNTEKEEGNTGNPFKVATLVGILKGHFPVTLEKSWCVLLYLTLFSYAGNCLKNLNGERLKSKYIFSQDIHQIPYHFCVCLYLYDRCNQNVKYSVRVCYNCIICLPLIFMTLCISHSFPTEIYLLICTCNPKQLCPFKGCLHKWAKKDVTLYRTALYKKFRDLIVIHLSK